MKKRGLNIAGVIFMAVLYSSCGDEAIFDNMADSNISVILKGSYESNGPVRSWIPSPSNIDDDTMTNLSPDYVKAVNPSMSGYDDLPSVFRLDVAEVRINGDKFANYRKTYNASTDDGDPFFNGTGITLKCDSVVRDKRYDEIELYTRKMIFNNAKSFAPETGVLDNEITTVFDESYRPGYDINPDQILTLYDTLREEKSRENRIFPLRAEIPGGFIYDGSARYVIEIRMLVKNFLRRYEKVHVSGDQYRIYHFFGFSDAVNEIRQHDDYIGGNVLTVARAYSPDLVTTISGSGSGYIVAIPATDDIADYDISSGTTPSRPDDTYIPRYPSLPGKTIAGYLEHYVELEKYKDFYGDYVLNVNKDDDTDTTSYHNVWNAYNDRRKNLRLPPLATWGNGAYTLTNVPPGDYMVYKVSDPGWGELPNNFGAGVLVTVTENDALTHTPVAGP